MPLRTAARVDTQDDPIMATFDRGVALTAYGLLFISPFLLGSTALGALGMAFAHRNDAHSLMRSHYRFQMRLFWTTVVALMISGLLAFGAGGLAFGGLYALMRDNFPNLPLPAMEMLNRQNAAVEESWLMIAAIVFFFGGLLYLLANCAYGFIKLVAGRPIRHRTA
jgi:uncharacterized membrane protein